MAPQALHDNFHTILTPPLTPGAQRTDRAAAIRLPSSPKHLNPHRVQKRSGKNSLAWRAKQNSRKPLVPRHHQRFAPSFSADSNLQRFARHGGPDLTDVRGVRRSCAPFISAASSNLDFHYANIFPMVLAFDNELLVLTNIRYVVLICAEALRVVRTDAEKVWRSQRQRSRAKGWPIDRGQLAHRAEIYRGVAVSHEPEWRLLARRDA